MTTPERTKIFGTIAGEQCEFYSPLAGQISALVRVTQVALNEDLPISARMDSLVLAEDIIMSLLAISDERKAKLTRQFAMGEVDLGAVLNEVMTQVNAQDVEAAAPVKRGRGRPRKATA